MKSEALSTNIKLLDRYSWSEWFTQLKAHADLYGIWKYVNPDQAEEQVPKSFKGTAAAKPKTFDEWIKDAREKEPRFDQVYPSIKEQVDGYRADLQIFALISVTTAKDDSEDSAAHSSVQFSSRGLNWTDWLNPKA